MNIEKYKIDHSKLNIGDKLWSIQLGDCTMRGIGLTPKLVRMIVCDNAEGEEVSYTEEGFLQKGDHSPSLFNSNPFADNPEPVGLMGEKPESILQEAERLINGDRAAQYGDAHENFGDIAKGWSVLFKTHVTAEQVAIAMIWLKMCRFNHKEGRDSIVDIAGYAGCVEKIQKGGKK